MLHFVYQTKKRYWMFSLTQTKKKTTSIFHSITQVSTTRILSFLLNRLDIFFHYEKRFISIVIIIRNWKGSFYYTVIQRKGWIFIVDKFSANTFYPSVYSLNPEFSRLLENFPSQTPLSLSWISSRLSLLF